MTSAGGETDVLSPQGLGAIADAREACRASLWDKGGHSQLTESQEGFPKEVLPAVGLEG